MPDARAQEDCEFVWVRRQWNDYRIAKFRLESITGLHWTSISGGVMAPAPREFLHGYVYCDEVVDGELPHSCGHGHSPHWIKVCIVKKNNSKSVFDRLVAKAPPKERKPK